MTRSKQNGFTLVELLVVIGIIAVLVSILLPVIGKARRSSSNVYCRQNLRQIGLATRMYANDNNDHYPDGYTLGGANMRVGAGKLAPGDPAAIPEIFGLPALYKETGYLKDAKIWLCPDGRPTMYEEDWGNTYQWALLGGTTLLSVQSPANTNQAKWTSGDRGKPDRNEIFWVWDNVAFLPWTSGSRRTTGTQGTWPPAQQTYPHEYQNKKLSGKRQGAINVLFIDGHAGVGAYTVPPGGTTPQLVVIREP